MATDKEQEKKPTRAELEKSLNEQQKRFCEAKLFNNNVKAYMIAYEGCTYKAASTSATRLLEDARILTYIEYLKLDIEGITGVSKIKNIAELAKIAYSSISDIHETWIDLDDWEQIKKENPEVLSAIESIDTKTEAKTIHTNDPGAKDVDIEVKYVKISLYPKIPAIKEINLMMGYNEPEKRDITTLGEKISKAVNLSIDGKEIELK